MASGIDLKMKVSGANKVQRELKQTGKAARGMGAGVSRAGAAMGGMAAAINPVTAGLAVAAAGFVAVAVAAKVTKDAFVGTIKATLKLADELDTITKKAQSIGATNTDLQLVTNAMSLFGVESGATLKSLQHFNRQMGKAMLPDAPKLLTDAFDRLGVSAKELSEMTLKDRFIALASGLEKYSGAATRGADANEFLGRSSKDALTAFNKGGAAMRDAMDDVERYGIASDQAFRNSENLMDAQLRLELAFKGLKADALEPLMPVLEGVAQGLADLLTEVDPTKVDEFGDSLADMAETAVVALMATGPMLEQVAKGLKLLAGTAALLGLSEFKKLEWITGGLVDLEGSQGRWGEWGDKLLGTIREVREAARGPILGPHGPPVGGGTGAGTGGRTGGGTGGRRAGKVTDPLAGLKRELDAITKQLKTKEQLMNESLARQVQATQEAVDAKLISEQRKLDLDVALITAHDTKLLEMAEAHAAKERAIADRSRAEEKAANERAAAEVLELRQAQQAATLAIIGSVGSFAGSMSSIIIGLADEQNKEAKEAAKVFFGIQQAAALAGAIVSTAAAVARANERWGGPPVSIPFMVAAGAVGAAEIATITATTIQGMAHAGLPPGALGPGSNEATIMMRRDEMILDPVGTKAISQMLNQRTGGGQPIQVSTTLELDGDVLGRTVDNHLVRSSERGTSYQDRIRY